MCACVCVFVCICVCIVRVGLSVCVCVCVCPCNLDHFSCLWRMCLIERLVSTRGASSSCAICAFMHIFALVCACFGLFCLASGCFLVAAKNSFLVLSIPGAWNIQAQSPIFEPASWFKSSIFSSWRPFIQVDSLFQVDVL